MNLKTKRENIEAIYPLTELQQALLMHHLSAPADQGQLEVNFTIQGPLNMELLSQAWDQVVRRHECLRSTIHHENLKQAVRIVHKTVPSAIGLNVRVKSKLDLSSAPVDRISTESQGEDFTRISWLCHHILLDGWSTAVILKDLCTAYAAIEDGTATSWPAIPTYKSLLQWRRSRKSVEDETKIEPAEAVNIKPLFNRSSSQPKYAEASLSIPAEVQGSSLRMSASMGTTQSTWFQAVWAVVLSAWNPTERVYFGLTRSGRNIDFPGIEAMAGLFVKETPVLVNLDAADSFKKLLEKVHRINLKMSDLDHLSDEEVYKRVGAASPVESMLTFENIPVADLATRTLRMSTFSSGITSTYPLSLIVIPGEQGSLTLHYREDLISSEEADEILEAIIRIGFAASAPKVSVESLREHVPKLSAIREQGASPLVDRPKLTYSQPENRTQLQLVKIWEQALSYSPIGIDHHFFELGGTSLAALKMLGKIEQDLGTYISPALFLQGPTIRTLAEKVESGATLEWSSLVPLRASGSKNPVYCIHAGGAHVFFYQPLAQHLGNDQPVYGIQPQGLDGEQEAHSTIEDMARDYWADIKAMQPQGPWILLGYCFSVPVCIEMSKLIRKEGGEVKVLIVDSGPWYEDGPDTTTLSERVSKLISIVSNRNWKRLEDIIEHKTKKIRGKYLSKIESKHAANLLRMENALKDVYYSYNWVPFDGKITLIRSREFADRPDKTFHLEEWGQLATAGVEVVVVEAKHKTIFDEPDAINLAAGIKAYLAQE